MPRLTRYIIVAIFSLASPAAAQTNPLDPNGGSAATPFGRSTFGSGPADQLPADTAPPAAFAPPAALEPQTSPACDICGAPRWDVTVNINLGRPLALLRKRLRMQLATTLTPDPTALMGDHPAH